MLSSILLSLLTPSLVLGTALHARQDEAWWTPPSNISQALNEVWAHEISTYSNALGFKNYGYDQVRATQHGVS